MKKLPKWIDLRYDTHPPYFKCNRCGVERIACLPAAIDDFLKQGEAFAEGHKFCKEDEAVK